MSVSRYRNFFGACIIAAWVAACGTYNPLSRAETTEQKAWALYGTFVVFQEQAVSLVGDPEVPESLKARLRAADKAAYPVATGIFNTATEVIELRRQMDNLADTTKVDEALLRLRAQHAEGRPLVEELVKAVNGEEP